MQRETTKSSQILVKKISVKYRPAKNDCTKKKPFEYTKVSRSNE